jgi:cation diffusion facilitator family transporter
MSRSARSTDARLLVGSVWASAAFAVLSLVWGLLAGSQMIVFDGLYSFTAVLLSLLAVFALRTAHRGADERYPWGREVWEPVAIIVKAVALGGLCVYALVGAVGELLRGGREIAAGPAVVYAVLATAVGFAIASRLRRGSDEQSDLVRAEAAEWTGDALLGVGVLVGFLVAFVLQAVGNDHLARYVDPMMVAVTSAVYLWVPARLLAGSFREVLSMAPSASIQRDLRTCVDDVEQEYGFSESFLRAAKVGSRMDIEIDFVVAPTSKAQHVTEFDAVRQQIDDRLEPLGYEKSMSVTFTADRKWAV